MTAVQQAGKQILKKVSTKSELQAYMTHYASYKVFIDWGILAHDEHVNPEMSLFLSFILICTNFLNSIQFCMCVSACLCVTNRLFKSLTTPAEKDERLLKLQAKHFLKEENKMIGLGNITECTYSIL